MSVEGLEGVDAGEGAHHGADEAEAEGEVGVAEFFRGGGGGGLLRVDGQEKREDGNGERSEGAERGAGNEAGRIHRWDRGVGRRAG